MRIPILVFLLSILPFTPARPAEITAIAPIAAPPGQTVIVTGGLFSEKSVLFLGDQSVQPETIKERELKFTVPPLPEGEYALRVAADGEKEKSPFIFRVTAPVPRLHAVRPATVDTCSLLQGQPIILSGDFPPGSQPLLDGAVVPAEQVNSGEIALLLRSLTTGIHQIAVAAPDDRRSIPHALVVDSVPRIVGIDFGADEVTSYEVIIRGENFLFTSLLAVNGTPVSQAVEGDVEANYTAIHRLGGEDYLRYVDCQTLIYVRHPATRVPKSVTLQVVNPDGEQSPVYVVMIP